MAESVFLMEVRGRAVNRSVAVLKLLMLLQMALESASDIFSLRFNPANPMLVAGGCYNGQVSTVVL